MAKKSYLKLRRLYEDEGLEQQELAEMTGINPRTLGKRLGAPEADGCWLCKEITAICRKEFENVNKQLCIKNALKWVNA